MTVSKTTRKEDWNLVLSLVRRTIEVHVIVAAVDNIVTIIRGNENSYWLLRTPEILRIVYGKG
jgi:hypothetical protein